jgi:MoaA/NifB/PqqE/SkfB family radical SAM enzyme
MSSRGSLDTRFQPPSWLLAPRAHELRVYDLARQEGFDVEGELSTQLLHDREAARRALRGLSLGHPLVARFAADFERAEPVVLSRAALLAGSGFEQLFVELTAQCNERCGHCYADASPERREALDWRTIQSVLADARALGFEGVQLTGGDPLLSPHVGAAAQHTRALGFSGLEIYTNGLALTDAVYAPLLAARADFAFSFYSADPAVHDAITRTPGSQQRTLAAIQRVLADGLRTRASVIVTQHNRHTVAETTALLSALGLPPDCIAVDQERSAGRGRFLADELGMPATGAPHALRRSEFAGKASVAADGTVYPCIFSRELPLGSVHERSLEAILRDPMPLAGDLGERLATVDALSEKMTCLDCRVRNALLRPPEALVQLRRKEPWA